jgi:carboxypeptidase Q
VKRFHPAVVLVPMAAFAAAAILTAQDLSRAESRDRIDLAMVAKIRTEGTTRSRVLETFNYLTNVTGARPTGGRAHRLAADYVRTKLTEWGMANSRLEPFEFGRGWDLEKFSLELTAPRYFPMFGYPQAWTPSTKGVLTGAPIYVADKTEAEITALGETLRGAIVLASPPQTVFQLTDRLQPADTDQPVRIGGPEPPTERQATSVVPANAMSPLLQKLGAGAILRPGTELHGTLTVGGSPRTPDGAVPTVIVMAEHYNMIVRMMEAGVVPQLRLELRTSYLTDDLNSYNVIAEIPGEDPVLRSEVVIVGAHLDSLPAGAGATDNADGVVASVEAMRILKAVGARPRRTIRVAIWSGEEVGFVGGRAYVQQHLADAAARDKIAVYLNNDPGGGATYGWYMANNAAARAIFDSWLEPLKDLGLKRNVMDSNFTSEDGVFDGVGIPAFTTIMDYTNYDARTRHTNVDFYEAVSEKDLQQSAIVMAVFAYQSAMRDQVIPRRPAGVPASPRPATGRGGRGAPTGRGAGPAPGR